MPKYTVLWLLEVFKRSTSEALVWFTVGPGSAVLGSAAVLGRPGDLLAHQCRRLCFKQGR